jgi:hypothetical protein
MGLPFKPGDWVADTNERVARVRDVYFGNPNEVLLDLVLYEFDGTKLGRVSPACGGPRSFEPACPGEDWKRVKRPNFPMVPRWVPVPGSDYSVCRYHAGDRLPALDWTPTRRRGGVYKLPPDDSYERALKEIAAGHNDPRTLAKKTLGMT